MGGKLLDHRQWENNRSQVCLKMISGIFENIFLTFSFEFKAISLLKAFGIFVKVYLKIRLRASKTMPYFGTLEYYVNV